MSGLRYQVVVDGGSGQRGLERRPLGRLSALFPLTSTLIFGDRSAVLVDPPVARSQAARIDEWVQRFGRTLTHVYATGEQSMHPMSAAAFVSLFPGAIACASETTIARMHRTACRDRAGDGDPAKTSNVNPIVVQPVPVDEIRLDGEPLLVVEVGATDAPYSDVLYAPSMGLVVAGGLVCNGVHPYLPAEVGGIKSWLKALGTLAVLGPRCVVAGHKGSGLPDDPYAIVQTRDYLLDAQRLAAGNPTPTEFFDYMMRLYPTRLNADAVRRSALALLSRPDPVHVDW